MYETILVPLDGSRRAERILPHVEELARVFRSKIVFLQVVEIVFSYPAPYGHFSDPDVEQAQREKLRQEASAYLAGLQGEFSAKAIEAKAVVAQGPVVHTIITIAEQENVDLIAMASHGRSGLARVFYGSVAAGVLHQVDRPLLIIRAEEE